MQFQVPQFLDVEDKIIGPLTIKQFIYLAGSVGLAYMAWYFIPFIGLFVALACMGLGAALAFYKFNTKPFIFIIESAFNYMKRTRLYVWKRREKIGVETHLDLTNFTATIHTGTLPLHPTASKLSDLTWSMDIQPKESAIAPPRADSSMVM